MIFNVCNIIVIILGSWAIPGVCWVKAGMRHRSYVRIHNAFAETTENQRQCLSNRSHGGRNQPSLLNTYPTTAIRGIVEYQIVCMYLVWSYDAIHG